MRMQIWRLGTWMVSLWLLAAPVWSAPAKGGLAFEQGFAPGLDVSVWPLQIAHGYPLVRGEVGGVKGVFMIDTGTPWGLLLNSARIKLPDAAYVLTATAGSGQKFDVSRASTMPAIRIHGQTWAQVREVNSADLSFIEEGTGMGTYLGFIGANFFKDCAFTLDYARRVAVVQRLHPDTGAPRVTLPADRTGGTVVASLHYRGEHPSFPVFDASMGGVPVRVMLDSGNPGASIDHQWFAELQNAGAAQAFSVIDETRSYRMAPLLLGGVTVPVEDASVYDAPSVIGGQTDRQLVKIGFSLLKHLGVTWNYRLQTMTFFTP